jgi:hypothetical protein
LEGKIHQATGLLLELCDAHGLSPNLGAGKTEALLIFPRPWFKETEDQILWAIL